MTSFAEHGNEKLNFPVGPRCAPTVAGYFVAHAASVARGL